MLFLLCLLLRLPAFWIPLLDIDESQFALFANTLLEGGLPYVDSVDTKAPGIYWFYAAIFWLFGKNNMIAVHLVTALWVWLTALLLKRMGGFWAALFYIVFTTTYTPKFIATSIVVVMMLPLTASIYGLMRWEAGRKMGWVWLSGVLFGVTCLFKYQAGIHLLIGLVYLWGLRRNFKAGCLYVCGGLLPAAGLWIYLHALGVWGGFVLWSLKGSEGYIAASLSAVPILKQIVIRFGSFVVCTLMLWILGVPMIRRWRELSDQHRLIVLWFLFSLVPVFAGFRFYGHYFIQLLPSLALLAAWGWEKVQWRRRWLAWGLVLPAAGCFAARLFIGPIHDWTGEENLARYQPAARYVAQLTQPEDKIYVWGFATPIYFYAGRRPASRFLWNDWQTGRVGGGSELAKAGEAVPTFATKTAWRMLFDDLKKNRPLYFLDTAPGNYHDYGKFPARRYPALAAYLDRHYVPVERRFGVDFYRRKTL